jgi:hypothetical protein
MPNRDLPLAYARAEAVLNDHWPDMARLGFLSNRLFDAVASGARVVSDDAVGLTEVFGDRVAVWHEGEDLRDALKRAMSLELPPDDSFGSEHSFDARVRSFVELLGDLGWGPPHSAPTRGEGRPG